MLKDNKFTLLAILVSILIIAAIAVPISLSANGRIIELIPTEKNDIYCYDYTELLESEKFDSYENVYAVVTEKFQRDINGQDIKITDDFSIANETYFIKESSAHESYNAIIIYAVTNVKNEKDAAKLISNFEINSSGENIVILPDKKPLTIHSRKIKTDKIYMRYIIYLTRVD